MTAVASPAVASARQVPKYPAVASVMPSVTACVAAFTVPETVAGHRWRAEMYDPVLAMVPADLVDRLAPAEVFHEILEHRWFLSEQAATDVGTTAAAQAYIKRILPQITRTLTVLPTEGDGGAD